MATHHIQVTIMHSQLTISLSCSVPFTLRNFFVDSKATQYCAISLPLAAYRERERESGEAEGVCSVQTGTTECRHV